MLVAACGDDERGVEAEGEGGTSDTPHDPLELASEACREASDTIEQPHDPGAVFPLTVRDAIDDPRVPQHLRAVWSELDPGTPAVLCSFDLKECENPGAISGFLYVYVIDFDRVDVAEVEETDCNFFSEGSSGTAPSATDGSYSPTR